VRKAVRRSIDSERMLRRAKKLGTGVVKHLVLITLTILSLYPLYFVIVNSVKTKIEYNSNKIGLPPGIVFDAYKKVFFGEKFPRWLTNTLIVTVASVLLCLFFSSMAGFVISKMEFKGKRLILNSVISLMVIPVIVMIIPLFVLFGQFRLNNSYISVIVIYIGVLLPFNVYLLYSYFITVPQSILDSALIDGCGSFRIYRSIMIPLSASALMTLVVYDVLWAWNEFLISLIFLQREKLRTLMVGLTLLQGRYTVNVPTIMAGLVSGILPILVLYIFTQKYFVKGLVAGAIKG
jgi:ABC-type glycerol-3-phosphate transport system permease component